MAQHGGCAIYEAFKTKRCASEHWSWNGAIAGALSALKRKRMSI